MPAKNSKQRKLFGAALGFLRDPERKVSNEVKRIAETVGEAKIRDFARKRR